MKIAVIGDLHWGARNDNQEFLNYFQRFFDNVFFPELEERGISNVLQVGDFVDRRKFISFVTLNHVREKIFGESHKRGITWDILVGNHDTPYKNTNAINSLQELFSQYKGISFYPDPTEINLDGLVENKGILYIWNDKDLKSRELEIKVRDELGVKQQLVNKSEIHDLEPNIKPFYHAGVYYPYS